MPLHLDPSVRGRHVKLGDAWVKLADVVRADVVGAGPARRLVVVRRGGRPDHVYRGPRIDFCKQVLDREVGP